MILAEVWDLPPRIAADYVIPGGRAINLGFSELADELPSIQSMTPEELWQFGHLPLP
jgi:hypothetical protein